MFKQYRLRDYDFKLIILVWALSAIGIFAVDSAGGATLHDRQFGGLLMGSFVMLCISLIDYSLLAKLYWFYYVLNVILLVLVKIMGKESGGAQRWLNLAGIQFQPSELAKILLILFFSAFIMKHREKLNTFPYIVACCALFLVPLLLIINQPDLSTSIMVILLFCVLMFIGGLNLKLVIAVLAVAIPVFLVGFFFVIQPDQELIEDYQQRRILAWLHPEDYPDLVYQQTNSITAIGSGQLYGKGYKNNEITSVKNGNFISEPETDFIFAVIGEEFGFMGAVVVILLEFLIAMECVRVARKARDLCGSMIAAGMAVLVGFQAFINISVDTGLLPNTGIPLPFVSYGLTSLVSLYIGLGFVINIRLQGTRMLTNDNDSFDWG